MNGIEKALEKEQKERDDAQAKKEAEEKAKKENSAEDGQN